MPDLRDTLAEALADRYRIERELGQGGMALVYLALDVRHQRKVAIKVLRPELAAVIGAQRFLREIATIATLQHPHILGLIDSGEVGGTAWYVMPYVDGESLRTRLQREKQLPIPDALRIASEVAGALDYAHRQGVIHRDIKPENILLHEGSALIVDFGIALAVSVAGGTRMTETGMSLGTPHYMSPEQAMGEREITSRSDVYALGATLYEMLVGDPPFTGSTAQAVVSKVLTEDPVPPSIRRQTVPPQVEDAVLIALQKVPADRYASAAAFAAALVDDVTMSSGARRVRSRVTARWSRRAQALAALGGVLALVGTFWLGRQMGGARRTAPVVFGQFTQVTSNPGLEVHPALSPDGQVVAYATGSSAQLKVFIRPVAGGRAIPLTDAEDVNETEPRWSPDGTRVLFLTRGGVFSAPASGGSIRPEVPAPRTGAITSADWSPDGRQIVWALGDTLFLQAPAGSQQRLAVFPEPSSCRWSPDGAMIACASGNIMYMTAGPNFGNILPNPIVTVRVADGRMVALTDSSSMNSSPVWSPDGRWLYFVSNRDGPRDVYAIAVGSGAGDGGPIRLTTGLGAHSISLSGDGSRLAFSEYSATGNVWSLSFLGGPAARPVTNLTRITRGNHITEIVRSSRDGEWLLYNTAGGQNSDIYRVRSGGGEPERLTDSPAEDFAPDLSPDGRELAFHSYRTGSRDIFVMPLDGGPVQDVTRTPLQEAFPRWSPDGRSLTFDELTVQGGVWVVHRQDDGTWGAPVRRTVFGSTPAWSPDGRTLAYVTTLAGGSLYVIPADSGQPRQLLDHGAAGMPMAEWPEWSADGREIYFKSHDARGNASLWAIPAGGGQPRMLVRFDDPGRPSYRPSWTYHDTHAYVTIEDRQGDIWVARLLPSE